jgi:hypothetical protein
LSKDRVVAIPDATSNHTYEVKCRSMRACSALRIRHAHAITSSVARAVHEDPLVRRV